MVIPIAIPLNKVKVASVAKIGVTFSTAISKALIAPHIKPSIIPTKQAIIIQEFDMAPSSLIF